MDAAEPVAGAAAAAAPPPPLSFEEHFVVEGGVLGNGAFGEVRSARPTPRGEALLRALLRLPAAAALPPLVVKTPAPPQPPQAEAEREWRERDAARERAALATWRHPGIVGFFGSFASAADARPRIVLEACLGMGDGPEPIRGGNDNAGASRGDFWRWVATRLAPNDRVFRFIAWQLLQPVAFLHAHGVAHRDLKNENFLVAGARRTAAGEDVPVAKISDFGTARALPVVQQFAPLVRDGTLAHAFNGGTKYVGTPQHIAPEILRQIAANVGPAPPAAPGAALLTIYGAYTTKCDVSPLRALAWDAHARCVFLSSEHLNGQPI